MMWENIPLYLLTISFKSSKTDSTVILARFFFVMAKEITIRKSKIDKNQKRNTRENSDISSRPISNYVRIMIWNFSDRYITVNFFRSENGPNVYFRDRLDKYCYSNRKKAFYGLLKLLYFELKKTIKYGPIEIVERGRARHNQDMECHVALHQERAESAAPSRPAQTRHVHVCREAARHWQQQTNRRVQAVLRAKLEVRQDAHARVWGRVDQRQHTCVSR